MQTCFNHRLVTILVVIALPFSVFRAMGQHPVREYSLTIREERVNKAGKWVKAITVNDSIPAPTLYFTEGDSAVIHIKNELDEESSVHWHGILLPNRYDGVPYLTTPPILPGETYTARFVVRQHGTYWYHSHSMMQEQRGLYGALVIDPAKKRMVPDRDLVLLLSDWTNESPHHVMKNLKRNSEWYALKKGQAQSLSRVIAHHGLGERIQMAWHRMPPMDVSDVYYNAFLINGQKQLRFPALRPGERVRLRVIDGSASTFFHLQFAGGKMEMISADGQDVQPVQTDRVLIGIAETYDFLITIPDSGAYELRATAQDGSGYASAFLGSGPEHAAPALPAPDIYHLMAIQMQGMEGMKMSGMRMRKKTLEKEKGFVEKAYLDREDVGVAGAGSMQMHQMDHGMDHGMDHQMHGMEPDKRPSPGTDSAQLRPAMNHDMNMPGMDMPGMDMSGMEEMPAMHHQRKPGLSSDSDSARMDSRHAMHRVSSGNVPGKTERGLVAADTGTVAFNYDMLRALHPTDFDSLKQPVRALSFRLTGSMWRYNWSINGKTLSEDDSIQVHQGEVLRITMSNETMMYHPMHLHGHFFRVLNANGTYSPLKHTVIVPPMRTVTIEFLADAPGDWFFHCHVLYHMMAGMSRIFEYAGYSRPPSMDAFPKHMLFHDDSHYFTWGSISLASNKAGGYLSYSNRKQWMQLSGDYGWNRQLNEVTATYEYFATQYLRPYAGIVTSNKEEYLSYYKDHQKKTPDQDLRAVAGVRYLLPFFLNADLRIDSKAHVRLGVTGETWVLPRIWLHYGVNTDREFDVSLEGMISQYLSLTAGYDSDYKWGGGLSVRF